MIIIWRKYYNRKKRRKIKEEKTLSASSSTNNTEPLPGRGPIYNLEQASCVEGKIMQTEFVDKNHVSFPFQVIGKKNIVP